MFKKKKKQEYVPPIKPDNRVVKIFNEYRLVETFDPKYEQVVYTLGEKKILSYESKLILEKRDSNAMNEPFYIKFQEEPISRELKKELGNYYRMGDTYDKDRLMFDFLRELLVNGK